MGDIDGCLYLPTMKWDKNDFILTKIGLTKQHIDKRFGLRFEWKIKRSDGLKYDMRDARLHVNVNANTNNGLHLLYPFDDEINCYISWQRIYNHHESNEIN